MLQSSERMDWYNVNARTTNEIHASLRRLEDADAFSEQVMSEKITVLADQLDAVDQRLTSGINTLNEHILKLDGYVRPHIYNDDLQYFQTLYVGDLQVSSSAFIEGTLEVGRGLSGILKVNGEIKAKDISIIDNDGEMYTPSLVMTTGGGAVTFTPHILKVNGRQAPGYVLASEDLII